MNDLGLANENKLGITEGHEEIKKAIEGQFRGETGEIGLYLSMAKTAQREGYPEIGANKYKTDLAAKYKEANLDEVHNFIDEARHSQMLKSMLDRYFS